MAQYLDILRKQITKAEKARELKAAGYPKKSILQWLTMSPGQYDQAIRGKVARRGRAATAAAPASERIVTQASPRATVNPDNSRQIMAITGSSDTKSEKARKLAALGIRPSEIARLLSMSVGHVAQSVRGRRQGRTARSGRPQSAVVKVKGAVKVNFDFQSDSASRAELTEYVKSLAQNNLNDSFGNGAFMPDMTTFKVKK